ncbi:MAG: YicC family protein [Gammaproteobacteria bacterium]|nr:YicC family protein [Gammaproteobacteria bacterium]
MIKSMTAFARQQSHGKENTFQWEIRSVNHRFLELSFSLPEPFRLLEPKLRELIKAQLSRGKVDCNLHYPRACQTLSQGELNQVLLQQLAQFHQQLQAHFPEAAAPSLTEVLNWPEMLQSSAEDYEEVHVAILELFTRTLTSLVDSRAVEGEKLGQFLFQRVEAMTTELAQVKKLLPDLVSRQKQKLLDRFEQLNLSLNAERLEQEMVLYAQKLDVSEELERLQTHLSALREGLRQAVPVGRRLDFLLQESHREVNTLAAKSPSAEVAHVAVTLKLLLEQMREQTQNIE